MVAVDIPVTDGRGGDAPAYALGVIEDLLPAGVAWAEGLDPGELYPEEAEVVARAVPKRRLEFAAGRRCAREALAALGFPPLPLPRGEGGSPSWPPGVLGAITHCDGYAAAVAARTGTVPVLGIDAEPAGPLPHGVLNQVSLPPERSHLDTLSATDPGICWDRLLFSAKESIYKAWFPLARRWLDFSEAEVTFDVGGTFSARILIDGPMPSCHGRWMVRDGLVLTAVVEAPLPGPR